MRYYISDPHFFHNNVIRFDGRKFGDVDQMNEFMIYQWNGRVTPRDEVIILGDLSFGNGVQTNQLLHRLNGRKYLIEGNHDRRFLRDPDFDHSLLKWVRPYEEIQDNHRKICLSHYPIACYNGQYRINSDGIPMGYMLYGHVHNTIDEVLVRNYQLNVMSTRRNMKQSAAEPDTIPCNMINCFCVFSNYVPLTFDEWIVIRGQQLQAQEEINKKQRGK